jgi:LacI family transcriptional regulator
MRPTVNDIAQAAGVSLATVDRVLNARPGVRAQTVEKVNAAIAQLGYVRDVAAANLARRRAYDMVFVLPEAGSQFMAALRAAVTEAAAMATLDRTRVRVLGFPPEDPHALAALLRGLEGEADGVAVMAPETPPLRDAIRRLKAAGVAVVALVSDLPATERDHFVGVDNVAAGRTAAVLMGRFLGREGGAVMVLGGSMLLRESIERRLGFDAALAQGFPAARALPSLEGHEDPAVIARIVAAQMQAHDDIAGVYALGAGLRALLAALRDAPTRPCGRPRVVIAHELTAQSRAGLIDGAVDAVITQNLGHIARSALRVLRAKSDGAAIDPAQERIRIEIVIRENLPPDG